ncbi:MAG: phosphoheptose isomerase [Gammaproteobacteria bacterium]|nr:phosphoheptose isomerase [Gammaproteobacteria bacterium]
MTITQRIKNHFTESIQTKVAAMDTLIEPIARAADIMVTCIKNDRKILACGNGGSACDAQHFASEMINRLERERRNLPVIALTLDSAAITSISNDYHFDQIFVKPVRAFGQKGDLLFAISTSGNSENVIKAVEVAHEKQMPVVVLSGKDGGKLVSVLSPKDIEIRVPANRTMRIQEVHILVIHTLCDLIDEMLFG